MEFNKIWTKEKNDELRKMISEGFSSSEIISKFGRDLDSHPKGKYKHGFMSGYSNFLKEIIINPRHTDYRVEKANSNFFKDKYDYVLHFNLNNHDYAVVLFYYLVDKKESYNLLFTTLSQYTDYRDQLILMAGNPDIKEDDHKKLSNILERETNYNELYKLIENISYVIFSFYVNINKYPLSISDTSDSVKIRMYRNMIKDSFKNV